MNQIALILKSLGPARLAWIAAVLLGLIVFFVFIITRLTTPGLTLLYSGLDPAEAGQIAQRLETDNIPYEIRGDGTQIYAPEDQVAKLRLTIASAGLPSGGSIGYEIFDRADALGSTDFVQQISQLRALEGELARSIRSLRQVKAARVHLVLPKRELFARESADPTASVLVTLQGSLDKGQISAIQHLVAAAVPNLKIGNVSIIDSQGTLLARGEGKNDASLGSEAAEDMRRTLEEQKAREIEDVIGRSVGPGKVRAQVTAELDFSRITTSTENYDPNGQVVRSTQTVDDNGSSQERNNDNSVTVANNVPNPPAQATGGQNATQSQNARNEETVNYEISKSVRTEIQEGGTIKRITAAVLIDGIYESAADGTKTYKPRTAEEIEQYAKIVRSIVGFDEKRGDTVEIVNLRFAEPESLPAEGIDLFGFSRADLLRLGQMAILGIVAILTLLLVVRPLIGKLLTVAPPSEAETLLALQNSVTNSQLALSAPPATVAPPPPVPVPEGPRALTSAETAAQEIESMIDLNQVEGRVRASSLKKIGDLVANHPEVAVNIMRQWMHQES